MALMLPAVLTAAAGLVLLVLLLLVALRPVRRLSRAVAAWRVGTAQRVTSLRGMVKTRRRESD